MATLMKLLVSLLFILIAKASIIHGHSRYAAFQLASLLPASTCTTTTPPSITKDSDKSRSRMRVFHRHGPCSRLGQDKNAASTTTPSLNQVLDLDQSRVDSIQARLNSNPNKHQITEKQVSLPAKSGRSLGSGNYIATVGLGTPAKTLSLVFDTASDLTWTQCQPCARSCHQQEDPIFNPSSSSSYSNVSCNSAQCSQLFSATGNSPGCVSGTTCIYSLIYGDQSFTVGILSKDKLTISPTDVFPSFLFGCGQNNQGLFGNTAGIIGLGRDPLSLVSQTSSKYGKLFSYCLPSTSSSVGHLTFGKSGAANSAKFTPFASSRIASFYYVNIIAISIGGHQLPINGSVFKAGGSVIDSGTVITRLPPGAYSVMSSAFRQGMTKYQRAPAVSLLDTCYEFGNLTTVTIPTIAFTFGGNVRVDLAPSGILIAVSSSSACLAFAGNKAAEDVAIFGNTQQKTMEVVYDVAGGKLGFSPNGCS
ncbi:aspartyl protease family protein At5g10770-like [Henckelia pumila]|uniref:aspartyl protease family protein At5g10770-like n=1 Tax=Henckelia pumila TaxID=405737 RepID=UPI003C6E3C03